MKTVIFVTLKDGEYNDYWASASNGGLRDLHWCGQRKKRALDYLVSPGTIVAVREKKTDKHFTLVGTVVEKFLLTSKTEKNPATYNLLVQLSETPQQIHRAEEDRCTHWTVLRELDIPHNGGYLPEGIYSN